MVRSGEMADRQAERTPSIWTALAAALAVTVIPSMGRAQTPAPVAPAQPPNAAQQQDHVLLEADTITDDEQQHQITAEGDVQVRYQGRTMRSDRLVYDLNTATIHAIGHVELVSADGSAEYADEIQVDEDLNRAVATELRARFGPNGALAARSAIRHGPGESELRNVIYTSCPVCESSHRPPTWSLRARRAIQDQNHRTISYRDAVFEVTGVPVLYLPYFAHPDPTAGRTSGFLPPAFGRNRRVGEFYDQPYYWAISPYQDLTASVRLHSQVNPLFGVTYRKRFWSGQMEFDGTVTQEQNFDSSGNTFGDNTLRSSIFGDGRFRINDYWRWGFGVERTTDDLYLRRYDINGAARQRGLYVGTDTRLISQLYAVEQDPRSYGSLDFISFQGLRATDTPNLTPLILPIGDFERVYYDPVIHGQLRLDANTAVLQRNVGPDSARLSFGATWRKDAIFGPGLVVSPFAQARTDIFREETTPNNYETFSRTLGLGGVEVSWPFMRAGENYDFIIEPVVMAAYASKNASDPRIVNEDSLSFELDDSDLFRPNAAPNYDLWEPGGRLSAGVRATARAATGQSASLIIGRRWRSDADPEFGDATNLGGTASDWVGALQTDLGHNFASDVRVRFDDNLDVKRLDAGVRGAIGRFSASARYYSTSNVLTPGAPSRELTGSLGVELARGWRMQAALTRDLDSDTNLRQEIDAIYEDDCTFLEIAYTRNETVDRTLGPSEGIQVRIGLRSLGVLGGH